jgi:hypothetical protein
MVPKELLSLETLVTLGGAAFAVTLAGNVCRYVFSWNPRWMGLVVAMGLAGLGLVLGPDRRWTDWVVALFQGLQIYATAVGIASITGGVKPESPSPVVERGPGRPDRTAPTGPAMARSFWVRWF